METTESILQASKSDNIKTDPESAVTGVSNFFVGGPHWLWQVKVEDRT
jgi:hypothetical protein